MRSNRITSAIVLIVFAAAGLGACAAINEVLTTPEVVPDYDLTCDATPDELCLRIAILAVEEWTNDINVSFRDRDIRVEVKRVDCAVVERRPAVEPEPMAERCWGVLGEHPGYGFGAWVFERPDGTFGIAQ